MVAALDSLVHYSGANVNNLNTINSYLALTSENRCKLEIIYLNAILLQV